MEGWFECVVGPDLRCVDWGEKHPVDTGVYLMFDDADQLLYIGQSVGIEHRLAQHYKAGRRWTSLGAIAVPAESLGLVESAYIHALRPPLNRRYRVAHSEQQAAMVGAIRAKWERTRVLRPAPMRFIDARELPAGLR